MYSVPHLLLFSMTEKRRYYTFAFISFRICSFTRARNKVGEKCRNLTQNACFILYINVLRCVRFCVTFHVIAWDFSPFARKNISECSILADAGRTRTEQVGLYQQWYTKVPAVVHKSTSGGILLVLAFRPPGQARVNSYRSALILAFWKKNVTQKQESYA